MSSTHSIKYSFWGSSRFSIIVLDEMKKLGFFPTFIITTPDKPQGRKLVITPNVVKIWANENNVTCYSPEKLDDVFISELKSVSVAQGVETFIVASYGKIIPLSILKIPPHNILNIHPSLLPQYRGASPLQSAILNDTKNTGVTIMRIDEEMDHGPIVAQREVAVGTWPIYEDFEMSMAQTGATLLAETLPKCVNGEIKEIEQDHSKATYTKKITKQDAEIALDADAYINFRKIQAYHEWPKAFFMFEHGDKNIRVKITSATYKDNILTIEKVIPEGSKEMTYEDFIRGYSKKP